MYVIFSIARNTFREASRNKIFIFILFFASGIILLTKALAYISPEIEVKTIVDFGLASVLFFGIIIAIFSGASLVHKELDKQTIYTVIAKPVSRSQFVIGKYLGLLFTVLMSILIMSLVLAGYIVFNDGSLSLTLCVALYYIFLQISILTAISILFSLLSSPLEDLVVVRNLSMTFAHQIFFF